MQGEFLRALEDGDVALLRRASAELMPHISQPKSEYEAEIVMHHARTQTATITFAKRAYSHRWLTERGLPSGLPDDLKPKAERIYPRVVESVGLSCKSRTREKAREEFIRSAMVETVEDCYANGDTAPEIVKPRIQESIQKTLIVMDGILCRALIRMREDGGGKLLSAVLRK